MTEKKEGIEVMSRPFECECEKGPSDKEKLIRYRCAQSLLNISMDLKQNERMASNVCLVIAKGLMSDLKIPEGAGSMHSPQSFHMFYSQDLECRKL